ncbi:ArsI/CadI family heavy metal resistance metalloenzyme [Kitasatospora mediocidica]|uniref:ArsI/CadI family heavy metal resistance metalloenzyme n=1 Tax=Kitasatospora mediocidica TaxID=58352 RepID=UPI00055BAB1A|nr:ArsI/CadI family heavy metal resistance metalloenzyme [Kitasatospora mediocidica]
MSRVQLALRVADLEGSIAFYSKLFGTEPAKRRPGYANFAIAEPPLKLVLIEGEPGEDTRLDHLGVEVETTDQVAAATTRLKDAGLATFEEGGTSRPKGGGGTSCCYALQDKVWVHGPGKEPWEVYVVKADADTFDKATGAPDACCGTTACCTPDEQALDTTQSLAEAKAAAECSCGS